MLSFVKHGAPFGYANLCVWSRSIASADIDTEEKNGFFSLCGCRPHMCCFCGDANVLVSALALKRRKAEL